VTSNGRPPYPRGDWHPSVVWRHESQVSQQWSDEMRAEQVKRMRRGCLLCTLMAFVTLVLVVAAIVELARLTK
jgi:hypothetical protein